MISSKISREDFLNSRFLSIKLVDLEKSLLHRNVFQQKFRGLSSKWSLTG
jgi:hypothetical protein